MEKSKRKHGDMPIQTFTPSAGSKLGFVLIFVFVAIHFMIMTGNFSQIEGGTFHLIFVPFYGFMFLTLFLSSTEKIHIYEDGIEHCYGSRRSFVHWTDMSAFEWRSHGKSSSAGIRTHTAIKDDVPGTFIEKMLHWRFDRYYLRLSGVVGIPTRMDGCLGQHSVDLRKLRSTEFGSVVYSYAPHLFKGIENLKY